MNFALGRTQASPLHSLRGSGQPSDVVSQSGNNTLSQPCHIKEPGRREECYCGFALQEASIMTLFMALTAKNCH